MTFYLICVILIGMEEKELKYAENARKAQKAFYYRNKQKKDDAKMAEALHTLLYDTELEDMKKLWPKTLALIEEINN